MIADEPRLLACAGPAVLAAAVTLITLVLFFLNRSTPIEADLGSRQVDAAVAVAFLAFPTGGGDHRHPPPTEPDRLAVRQDP